MNIIVIGSGAREHALCRLIEKSYLCEKLYCFPGNFGISQIAECKDISNSDEIIEECGIESTQIKMVIQFDRNQQIKPAIYYTSEDEDGWNGILLKRCGPAINSTGNYIDALSNEISERPISSWRSIIDNVRSASRSSNVSPTQ